MAFATIEVDPLTATIGAVVSGVDLQQPLSDAQRRDLRAALLQHCVLFFRDQDLTDEEHLAFAETFAPVNRSAFAPPGAEGTAAFVEWLEDTPDSPPKADLWHTDVAFRAEPPDFAILNCREAPPTGGDTLWLSLSAVYEALTPTFRRLVDGLEIDARPARPQPLGDGGGIGIGRRVVYRPDPTQEGVVQPLVRVHPETGRKALYMCGEYMHGIVGMAPDESAALIAFLRTRLEDANVQCRWRWRPHDVVVWDERCTNHRAVSDHFPAYRLMRRCTAGTARPIGAGSTSR